MNNLSKKYGLYSNSIKMIAAIAMLLDHFSKVFEPFSATEYIPYGFYFNRILQLIGRIAFPIFVYFVAVGCLKTHDIKKYIFRLFIITIISEFCYDFAFSLRNYLRYSGTISSTVFSDKIYFFESGIQNVCLGFLLSVVAVYCLQNYKDNSNKNRKILLFIQWIFLYIIAALNQCDYWQTVIPFILILYIVSTNKSRLIIIGIWCVIEYLFVPQFNSIPIVNSPIESIFYTISSSISVIILYFYNGKKGSKTINKYFFYYFYPVHLLLLGVIRELIIAFS